MSRVFAVKFIPDEDFIFASAGWDDTVQVINNMIVVSTTYTMSMLFLMINIIIFVALTFCSVVGTAWDQLYEG